MSEFQYNYARAFALVVQGHPIAEVAEVCDIPTQTLKAKAGQQEWMRISREVASFYEGKAALSKSLKHVDIEQLAENRKQNYEQAVKLRAVAEDYIQIWLESMQALKESGTASDALKLGGPKTLRELACAIATIHELTYRALGDVGAKRDPASPDKTASAPQITINLPGVLVSPRGRKTVDVTVSADQPEEPSGQTISQQIDNVSENIDPPQPVA